MRIFLSSTCYDLKDLRAEVEKFLKEKGHETLLSDRASFPHVVGKHRHDICLENVEMADLFIIVLDSRYGAPYYKNPQISITWAELKTAISHKKEIMAFVRRSIEDERQIYKHNKKLGNPFSPFFADNVKTFDIIDEIQKGTGIWMQPFETSIEIKEKLNSLYETNHSPINEKAPQLADVVDGVALSLLSSSTQSFIQRNFDLNGKDRVDKELIESVINKIPDGMRPWGEIGGGESIPTYSDDFFYFAPVRPAGDEGEILIGIFPTALGRSVKSELNDILKGMNQSSF